MNENFFLIEGEESREARTFYSVLMMKYDKDKSREPGNEKSRKEKTFNFGCNRCVLCNIMPWKIKPALREEGKKG